jgi:cytochrome c oxidase accessory protein FixG
MSQIHLPVLQEERRSSLRTDGKRNFVYTADVSGRFATARKLVFFVLIAIYVALPWIPVAGHPAAFLDVERREFYLFGAVFNSQDIWMTVFLATGAMFALVYVTAVAGRVWCGYACPQTVFLDGVYRKIERLVEGPRTERMRRDKAPLDFSKLWRKALKHALFAAVSLALAHVFLAYFVSIPRLLDAMRHRPSEHPEAFAVVMALAGTLHFNFVWFREQFCVVMCPYGRLQSVLLDNDSLVVGYDAGRGEPRAKGKQKAEGKGDCVDCNRCVVVCPTGIDIRNGLQMDCIACTACIDACDEVMDKLGRPRGLIRYDSTNGLAKQPKRLLRSRLYAYTALGALGLAAATFAFSGRVDYEANMLRAVGAPYTIDGDVVTNSLRVHLVNKRSETTTFTLAPAPVDGATFIVPLAEVTLPPLGYADAPIFVSVPRARFEGEFPIRVIVRPSGGSRGAKETVATAKFLGPAGRR